ncbi:hypothetical protein FB45DRAFT_867411 [Roridomyces roridus]|uniref:Uncharacterized protein n=1 Tax=Roridomyces roridus TaxID=1738132 RepID=A0AAD7BRQ2_9AGAR|nr:hypothetical protein FB45DRAFT_867411 [Roridomyces roridus]
MEHTYEPITRILPLDTFPRVTSLALLQQCFTVNILTELFGRDSKPWPLLETVAVWPLDADADLVYEALQEVVHWKRSCSPAGRVPLFVLSPDLYEREFWEENEVKVELLEDLDKYVAWD